MSGTSRIEAYPSCKDEDQAPAIAVFAARVTGGEPVPLDETLDVKSFPREGLPWAEMAFPSTEHALKDYLRWF